MQKSFLLSLEWQTPGEDDSGEGQIGLTQSRGWDIIAEHLWRSARTMKEEGDRSRDCHGEASEPRNDDETTVAVGDF